MTAHVTSSSTVLRWTGSPLAAVSSNLIARSIEPLNLLITNAQQNIFSKSSVHRLVRLISAFSGISMKRGHAPAQRFVTGHVFCKPEILLMTSEGSAPR